VPWRLTRVKKAQPALFNNSTVALFFSSLSPGETYGWWDEIKTKSNFFIEYKRLSNCFPGRNGNLAQKLLSFSREQKPN
jgi:hypothetical protein